MAATDQISRGLDQRGRPGSGPSLQDIAAIGVLGIAQVKSLKANAEAQLQAVQNVARLVQKRSDEEYERTLALFQDQPGVSKREAQKRAQQAADQRRRNELKAAEGKRSQALQALEAYRQQARIARELYGSPAAMLSREALRSDSERRKRLEMAQLLAHAGPAELRSHARLAAATGDRLLGAAVLQRLDAMNADQRDSVGVSRNELSEVLVGEDHAELVGMLDTVEAAHQDGITANREAEKIGRASCRERGYCEV